MSNLQKQRDQSVNMEQNGSVEEKVMPAMLLLSYRTGNWNWTKWLFWRGRQFCLPALLADSNAYCPQGMPDDSTCMHTRVEGL